MSATGPWLSAEDALTRLGVKPQTLYASVSRGRIEARPDPADSRRSLYRAADVERLAARTRGRPRTSRVAEEAISWGDPVLASAVSTIVDGRLTYRGVDVVPLSARASLEDAAALLWGRGSLPGAAPTAAIDKPGVEAAYALLAHRAATESPSFARSPALLREVGAELHASLATALIGPGEGLLHDRLAIAFDRPAAVEDIRRALVLLADHELNASTFAARVVVSTGASFAAGLLAGLAALSGPLHGDASSAVLALTDDIGGAANPVQALRDWLEEGRAIPGFGHRLYRHGDVRAAAMLAATDPPARFARLSNAVDELSGERPNVDFALAALTATHQLPREAPLVILAVARSVGWIAHMLEQAETGTLIRPRARYVGEARG